MAILVIAERSFRLILVLLSMTIPAWLTAFPNAFNDLNSLLSKEQLVQLQGLQNDPLYLEAFPFDLYVPRRMPTRGLFYDDLIYDGMKLLLRKENEDWEPQNSQAISSYTIPNTIVLDIGAHIGTHTVTMSRVVNNGVVLAFEPQKKVCRELEMNLLINKCNNVIPVHCALGDTNRTAYMGAPVDNNEAARFISNYNNCEAVEMRTLDSFHLNNISFIKIDTENFEKEVLIGAKDTIMRNRPVMLVEIQGNNVKAQEDHVDMDIKTRESIRLIQNMGYNVYHYACFDYLAIPLEHPDDVQERDVYDFRKALIRKKY